jgi:hypothetical protein
MTNESSDLFSKERNTVNDDQASETGRVRQQMEPCVLPFDESDLEAVNHHSIDEYNHI